MILPMLLMVNILAISSTSWIMLWMFMELSTYMFISFSSIMITKKSKNELALSYFLMSFLSSLFMLSSFVILQKMPISFLSEYNFMEQIQVSKIMLSMAFLLKMGSIPMHNWMFSIMENMEWNTMLILTTVQKIIPIWALTMFMDFNFMLFIVLMSSLIIMFLPLKTKSSFYFMSSSSVMNNIWVISSIIFSVTAAFFYTAAYFLLTATMIMILKNYNILMMNMNFYSNNVYTAIFSLIGMPPLLGFLSKMNSIMSINMSSVLSSTQMNFLIMIMVVSTTLTSFMYLKMLIPQLTQINNKNLFFFLKSKKINKMIMVNIMFPSMFFLVEMMI